MRKQLFSELLESMGQAVAHAQGKRELRTTTLPAAPAPMSAAEIRFLRARLNASQAVFARFLNVSTQLVQAWEADRRHPDGAALRLLEVARREPSAVFVGLVPTGSAQSRYARPHKRLARVSEGRPVKRPKPRAK